MPVSVVGPRKKFLKNLNMKTVPLSRLKYLNPVAMQIKRNLGKDFGALSLVTAKRGNFKNHLW